VSFTPRLPDGITMLAFSILIRGQLLRVEVTHQSARYLLSDGDPLEIVHHGKRLTLSAGQREEQPIPKLARGAAQPAAAPRARAPQRRRKKAGLASTSRRGPAGPAQSGGRPATDGEPVPVSAVPSATSTRMRRTGEVRTGAIVLPG
jgi:Glycosyl hydrolase family 65, C-terminal domain